MIDRISLAKEWLEAAKPTAERIGCSPSAIVAQAVLETGWGASAIGNNIFGIKADASWTGARRLVRTREVLNGESVMMDDWFRDYPSVADSFADHFAFLSKNKRYADAGVFDPEGTKSDLQYFEALQRAGYATDPNYAESLAAVQQSVEKLAGLQSAPPPPTYLTIGDKGELVRKVQKALNEQADMMLDEDGDFGSLTYLAVKHFQRGHGLLADGIVGPQTLAALGL